MNEEKKVSVIIPAYNEEDSIGRVLDDLLPMADTNAWEVIVVDDGSTDATAKLTQQSGVKVITHPYNQGYGRSLKTGITLASGNIIVIMDSDGQHDHGDIPWLLEHINNHDVVIGEHEKANPVSLTKNKQKSGDCPTIHDSHVGNNLTIIRVSGYITADGQALCTMIIRVII